MIVDEEDYIAHYGILRKSGRYPWGSGDDVETRSRDFLGTIQDLKRKGLSEVEIARGMALYTDDGKPWSTTEFRAARTLATAKKRQADIIRAERMRAHGNSNSAIARAMGIGESQVRSLLTPGKLDRANIIEATSQMLKSKVDSKGYIDVGAGVEHRLGISETKLKTAVAMLKEQGYVEHKVQVPQIGTGKMTTVKVLAPEGTTYTDVKRNLDKIHQIQDYSEDGGRSWTGIEPPLSIGSKRVGVRYKEDGGDDADGVIYVRRGPKDLSLGGNNYAQVRIAVDGTHYLKGMAIYKDDMPDGVDLVFNTNKSNTGNKLDAMKPIKRDADGNIDDANPFGAVVRQLTKELPEGKKQVTSVMNIVNDEGDWEKWSRNIPSQMLSKQSHSLAKTQLNMTYERRKNELDAIMNLSNPAVRRKLLEDFAESADAAAVHLKAAALPRQKTHVLLPVNSMKETEVYAPNFRDGERVVLIRFPHGGKFEIPELTVNNRNPGAKKLLGNAPNAIGINSKVAQKLSGADFDGDTVLVIPNSKGLIKHEPSLRRLKDFDPQFYKLPKDSPIKRMSAAEKGTQMGIVSNLITDMTIKGATHDELAKAVRHSMVVIDAEKHELNWKQSALDHGIAQLAKRYQGQARGGASTLISQAKGRLDIVKRTPRAASKGGPIDPETGRLVWDENSRSWLDARGKEKREMQRSTKLAEATDAHTLSSGTNIEQVYANHSNSLKALANQARKASVHIRDTPYSPAAKKAYAAEVASLDEKLITALKNAPLERQAQIFANAKMKQIKDANPGMEKSEIKKLEGLALASARVRTEAGKKRIKITDAEWNAIQAGAITSNKLDKILDNADLDLVKQLATPKSAIAMTPTKKQRAAAMLAAGYTQADVADHLGVSVSTLTKNVAVGGE